ncbi:MAG: sigma 54-interacting transcriptional regulator [Lacipirellulaceae bacterium]
MTPRPGTPTDPTPPVVGALAVRLVGLAAGASELVEFDRGVVGALRDALAPNGALAGSVQLWRPGASGWAVVEPSAVRNEVPEAAVEALDAGTARRIGPWTAACVRRSATTPGDRQDAPDVVAVALPVDPSALGRCAELWGEARRVVAGRLSAELRSRRLDELLAIAVAWSQTDDTPALLAAVAEAATRLFDADRATLFLWDRPGKRLVGRPALGMPDGQLVVPDDAGVVGRVVQTGEVLRAAPTSSDAGPVDRTIDRKTGYRTDSLVCVPLDAPTGERLGAFELLNKRGGAPGRVAEFTDDDAAGLAELARLAGAAVASARDYDLLAERRDSLVDQVASGVRLLGESAAIVALRKTVDRVADADLAVLVLGENGTGKEVVAQALHYRSRRRAEPLLAVNCAAIAETLLESELFGHEAGAFTDAREARAGKFELADGGTLLLDEIGDMSPAGQAKLLRVLEDKSVVRVGASKGRQVDVRVVAATNRDLLQRVREGKFREDLYYRLCVVTLELPPLRERGEDVLLLAEHFLKQFCQKRGRKPPKFAADARKRLLSHSWPGNVRELRNQMERVAYLTDEPAIDAAALGLAPRSATAGDEAIEVGTLPEATRQFQQQLIEREIARSRGNVAAAAERLGLHRSNLYRKMKQLGMAVEE